MTGKFTFAFQPSFKAARVRQDRNDRQPAGFGELEVGMIENQKIRPAQVIGPLGEPLTLDSLPAPSTTRWVVRRKAEVVAAVNGGLLSVDEACERYGLTLEEFASWQRAVDRSGMPGLRVTRIQHYKSLIRAAAEILISGEQLVNH
jgi:hypothetical protein